MNSSHTTNQQWAQRLTDLGRAVRSTIIEARQYADDWATPITQEGGDTIFAIDRHVEPVLETIIESWHAPLTLIAEGLGQNGLKTFGNAPTHCLIADPIDGTRNLMYDKRSAWFLAAIIEGQRTNATLADAITSVMVELPTSKQGHVDVFSATQNAQTVCIREKLDRSDPHELAVRPSQSDTLYEGFAQVSNFFPGTKVLASQLMEQIVEATLGEAEPGTASVFDDQYITTGGQMIELMMGRDRFCCDLRPLFYQVLKKHTGHTITGIECHPYDVAGLLAAKQAGVIITDGLGNELRPPLDVHSPVHWCGYANEALREQIEPVILHFFKSHGIAKSEVG